MRYNFMTGGNIKKGFGRSTLASGLSPFRRLGYAGDIRRNQFSMVRVFDGGSEEWHEAQKVETPDGAGFAVGDQLCLAIADPSCVFEGAILQLKKDLPASVSLKIDIMSNAADPSKDSFTAVTQTLAVSTTAGDAYIPPHGDATDFSTGGLSLLVTFLGASGVATGTVLDLTDVCFGIRLDVRDMHIDYDCVCARSVCPASYPDAVCPAPSTVDVSGFAPAVTGS